jgi:Insertion element 4 transposase N-terminal
MVDRVETAGHLGEVTQIITPPLVDTVLEKTGRVQSRVRKLPAQVMVYFVLAMALFGECGYRGVWAALVSGPGIPDVDDRCRCGGHVGDDVHGIVRHSAQSVHFRQQLLALACPEDLVGTPGTLRRSTPPRVPGPGRGLGPVPPAARGCAVCALSPPVPPPVRPAPPPPVCSAPARAAPPPATAAGHRPPG